MPAPTGYTRTPKLAPGAFIQLVPLLAGFVPQVVTFQYNPESIKRSFNVYADGARNEQRGQQSPLTQPFAPDETIDFSLVLDAADGLADDRVLEKRFGITAKLSALERLIFASGDLAALSAGQIPGFQTPTVFPVQPRVPTTLLVLGHHRLLPVRITSMNVDEELFAPDMRPIRATVALGLKIISEEQLKSSPHPTDLIARAAYLRYRAAHYDLAAASILDTGQLIKDTLLALDTL